MNGAANLQGPFTMIPLYTGFHLQMASIFKWLPPMLSNQSSSNNNMLTDTQGREKIKRYRLDPSGGLCCLDRAVHGDPFFTVQCKSRRIYVCIYTLYDNCLTFTFNKCFDFPEFQFYIFVGKTCFTLRPLPRPPLLDNSICKSLFICQGASPSPPLPLPTPP